MNVYLEAFGSMPPWHDQLILLRDLASKDEVRRHIVVSDRASAEIVLTVFHEDIRFCNLDHDDRRFAFCTHDLGYPALPGLYSSLTPWNAHLRFARSSPYLPEPWDDFEVQLDRKDFPYLFSFVGSVLTSPIRQQILTFRHPRGLLRDSSSDDAYKSDQSRETYQRFGKSYRRTLADSLFVLCPRGVGASSVRLFDTMRAGRVPVVISDHWVPPMGVPWNDFIIRIDEKDIASIPQRLESLEGQAREMGQNARKQWEMNFSESRIFDWMIEQIAEMRISVNGVNSGLWKWKLRKMLHRRNIRYVTLPWLKKKYLAP